MNIYPDQESWDQFNQNMSNLFDIEYKPTPLPQYDYFEVWSGQQFYGEANSFYGRKHTEETKNIIREKRKHQDCQSPEYRQKMSKSLSGDKNPFYGKKHTTETRKKISEYRCINEYVIIDPSGKEYKTNNLKAFCREHSITSAAMFAIIRGEYQKHKGWTCFKVQPV